MKDANVLISSAGRRVSLLRAFQEAVHKVHPENKVYAADMTTISSAVQCANGFLKVPRCTDPQFIETVLQFCIEKKIKLVVPTIDNELPYYTAARSRFTEHGIMINISGPVTIEMGGDKKVTHQFLTQAGLPCPWQVDAQEWQGLPRHVQYPLIAKPRFGSSSIGLKIVRSDAELAPVLTEKDYVIQEKVPGVEYTVDVFIDEKKIIRCAVPRKRLETRAGEVSKGLTVRNQHVIALAKQMAEKLPDVFGVINIQIFWEEQSNRLNVIEVNPRFGGGYPLSDYAGAKYADWIYNLAIGRTPSYQEEWKNGTVMLRFDEAIFSTADHLGIETK